MSTAAPVRVGERVREALAAGRPVVALESTVITHGLPRPLNLAAARDLEAAVETHGAVPATVGVLGGEVIVGLDEAELERLASAPADKVSLWNLSAVVARGADAGTTVATTLWAADAVGVRVFATGGIGGVHDAPFDESADLTALARFPVLTVCAGPKSILDVSATLERLETSGVPVVGYRSTTLAGFLVPSTGLPLPARVDSPEEAASLLLAQLRLGLSSGVVLSNPVSSGLDEREFAALRQRAEASLRERGVRGRDSTPFLLSELAELSGGRTVEVNTRLLEENARLAALVATALSSMTRAAEAGA